MLKMVTLMQLLYYSLRGCLHCHSTVINDVQEPSVSSDADCNLDGVCVCVWGGVPLYTS